MFELICLVWFGGGCSGCGGGYDLRLSVSWEH